MLSDMTDAAEHTRSVLALKPDFSADAYLRTLYYRRDADREHHRDALLKAGLPA
jgi:hypothetical protein